MKRVRGEVQPQEWFERGVALATMTPPDYGEAAVCFRQAAEAGSAAAAFNLGLLYESGRGVEPDEREARRWYEQAAEGGCSRAMFPAGLAYQFGRGGPADPGAAARWYRRGAERGDGNAMVNLGLLYLAGEGLPQDFVEAFTWLNSAVGMGRERVRGDAEAAEAVVQGRRSGMPAGWKPMYVREAPGRLCVSGACQAEPCPLIETGAVLLAR